MLSTDTIQCINFMFKWTRRLHSLRFYWDPKRRRFFMLNHNEEFLVFLNVGINYFSVFILSVAVFIWRNAEIVLYKREFKGHHFNAFLYTLVCSAFTFMGFYYLVFAEVVINYANHFLHLCERLRKF